MMLAHGGTINMPLLPELAECKRISQTETGAPVANTYAQIYIHVVFAVQGRQNLVLAERKEELHRYITGIVTRQGQKQIAINSMPDHVHLLVGVKPNMAASDL